MSKKLEALLEKFQGNSYPGMLRHLGEHLGVSAESLTKLALGFAPIVEFKKGTNFTGWWVIPERDSDGDPCGLSLRSQNDMKVMYPGSKHGLIYEVNENHERGGAGYQHGASNWLRTMDAGVLCPVCQRPDGCLVSAEDANDPKAVICIRTKEGAKQPMKFGFLHIRKSEGNIRTSSSALPDSEDPVLIVEGMSDAAAAMDMGFVSVGRPSNLACMDTLADLLRGRAVIVVGENDKKADGKEPGKEGMIAAFQVLRKVCRDIKMVMPPDHVKDLRAWKVKYGLTREDFLAYVAEHGEERSKEVVLPDARPLTMARAYLDDQFRLANRHTLKRWAGVWYVYNHGRYEEISEEQFEQPIFPWAHDKLVQRTNPTNGSSTLVPLEANNHFIANVAKAIGSVTLIANRQLPCWINGAKGPDPSELIIFNNGILHVPSFLEGKSDYLLDPTPDLFTTAALPYPFDPMAQCPAWKHFLRTSLGDEQEKIMLLREWFGYCMTMDTSMQKMMYMRGPTGAGKGTAVRVLEELVGKEHAASTSLASLATQFGLQPIVGKLICVIPDARMAKGADSMRGLEVLLNITGNDGVQVDRKFLKHLDHHHLTARITIASNDFLDLPDHAGAMLRRLNILDFKQTFAGREDFRLDDKLASEVPGIAVWALRGLQRLREQGRFTLPQSSMDAMTEWRTATNPLFAFIEECCDLAEGTELLKEELFGAWDKWREERQMRPLTKSKFFERVRTSVQGVVSDTYEQGVHKISVYRGISLKRWAARKFLGRPE